MTEVELTLECTVQLKVRLARPNWRSRWPPVRRSNSLAIVRSTAKFCPSVERSFYRPSHRAAPKPQLHTIDCLPSSVCHRTHTNQILANEPIVFRSVLDTKSHARFAFALNLCPTKKKSIKQHQKVKRVSKLVQNV